MPKDEKLRRIDMRPASSFLSSGGKSGAQTIYAKNVLTSDYKQSEAQGGANVPATQVQAYLDYLTNSRVSRYGDEMESNKTIKLGRDATDAYEAVTLQQLERAVENSTQGSEVNLRVDNKSGVVEFIVTPDYFRLGPPTSPGITYDWTRDNKVRVALETLDPPISTGVITDFTETVQDLIGGILVDTTTIDFSYNDGTPSITADIIAGSVANSFLANMTQATIKGRASGAGTGAPTDLSATQATAILDAMVGDSGSGGTKGLVPAPASGDAAAGKFLKSDGTWAAPSGAGYVVGPSSATDNAIVRFDLTTGKLIQNSLYSSIDDNGQAVFIAGTASSVPMTLRGAASQTGNLLLFQSSTPATLAYVDKSGYWNYNSPTSRNAFLNLKPVSESTSHYYIYGERYNGAEWFYVDTQANLRSWGTALFSARSNSIGTRALYAEKYGASGNVTAVEFGVIAPSTFTGTHIGVYHNSDVRPAASNFSGSLMAAKYYLYFENNAATSSTGSLYGAYFTFDDQGLYGTLANYYHSYFDGMRVQRSTGVITNAYSVYIKGDGTAHSGAITNQYGLYIGSVSLGATLKYAIYTNAGLVHFGDTVDLASGKNLTLLAGNITTDTTTGTKIGTATSQKLGFWNATPVIQPTTAGTASTFAANTSGIVNDTATWDSYTIGQVVKALRTVGILA